jgi:hypothetical protein
VPQNRRAPVAPAVPEPAGPQDEPGEPSRPAPSDGSPRPAPTGGSEAVAVAPRRWAAAATRWSVPALTALWVAVATWLQLVRSPGVPAWDTVWQEDGGVFLTEALRAPLLETVNSAYNGYLHVVPRLLAGAVSAAPLDAAALLLSGSSALVVALLSVYVYVATGSSGLLRSTGARAALAGLMVLAPVTGYEVTGSVANLHWYLVFAAFWALVARPATRTGAVVGVAVVALSVLSDPLTALLAPAVAWVLLTRRSRYAVVVVAVLLAGLARQLLVAAVSDRPTAYDEVRLLDLPSIYALRVTGSLLVGDSYLDEFYLRFGLLFAYASLLAVAAGYAVTLLRRDVDRVALLLTGALSVAFLVVPLALRGTEYYLDDDPFRLNGSRYTLLPFLFLATGVLMALDGRPAAAPPTAWTKLRAAVALVAGALVLVNYAAPTVTTNGPSWQAELDRARAVCRGEAPELDAPDGAPAHRRPGETRLLVAPNIDPPAFLASVDCDRLLADA